MLDVVVARSQGRRGNPGNSLDRHANFTLSTLAGHEVLGRETSLRLMNNIMQCLSVMFNLLPYVLFYFRSLMDAPKLI